VEKNLLCPEFERYYAPTAKELFLSSHFSLTVGGTNMQSADPIPFNKPCVTGCELAYIRRVLETGHLSGDGAFTEACSRLIEDRFDVPRVLLTSSCTAALEISAMLCDLSPGDEVIMPSYTFVTTASAFTREGAVPVFVDVRPDTLNIDERLIENAITPRTKAICVVHYGGVACEMDTIASIARRHNLILIEDAAQGVGASYKGRALGSIGDLGTYSFHETKNLTCGEGGALCINNPKFIERAEILRDKGTNRKKFFRGQVDKYTWVDTGSSYALGETCAALLLAQLEQLDNITLARRQAFDRYYDALDELSVHSGVELPNVPVSCQSNCHLFHLLVPTECIRTNLISELRKEDIQALFHYVPLHLSTMGIKLCGEVSLPITESISERLVRLPIYYSITNEEQERVISATLRFFAAIPAKQRYWNRTKIAVRKGSVNRALPK
jgi:dTDP-4-amino-4,6-dideoxygalactose transaminase